MKITKCQHPDYPGQYVIYTYIRLKDVRRVYFVEQGEVSIIECYNGDNIHTKDIDAANKIAIYLLLDSGTVK